MQYEKPVIEIIPFDGSDVVTVSVCQSTDVIDWECPFDNMG